jgi:hypothetical protein
MESDTNHTTDLEPSAEQVEERIREICRMGDLPYPDRVVDRIAEDGEVVCLWEEPKVAITIDVDER